MKGILLSTLILCLFNTHAALSSEIKHHESIMPRNSMNIPADHPRRGQAIDEALFNQIVDEIAGYYMKDFKSQGMTFRVEKDWNDGTVNAYAMANGNKRMIKMFGGLARHPSITPDGFAMVVCHEIGHHLGGATKYSGSSSWASAEGQADHWAANQCMKRYMIQNGDIWGRLIAQRGALSPAATKACQATYKNNKKRAICLRTAMAGLSLSRLFAGGGKGPDFTTPDQKKVRVTYKRHPRSQCRLDTYFQGGLCNLSPYNKVSNTDPNFGTCSRYSNHKVGVRPRCWYAPKKTISRN